MPGKPGKETRSKERHGTRNSERRKDRKKQHRERKEWKERKGKEEARKEGREKIREDKRKEKRKEGRKKKRIERNRKARKSHMQIDEENVARRVEKMMNKLRKNQSAGVEKSTKMRTGGASKRQQNTKLEKIGVVLKSLAPFLSALVENGSQLAGSACKTKQLTSHSQSLCARWEHVHSTSRS